MQTTVADTRTTQNGLLTTEAMEQKVQNKRLFPSGGPPSPHVGYESSNPKRKAPFTPVEQKGPLLEDISLDAGCRLKKLTRLKKDIVELLSSCEGNCLYISQLHEKYRQRFGRGFHKCYKMLLKGKRLTHFLAELDIVELEKTGEKGARKWLMKLKEPHASQFMMHMGLNTATELSPSSDAGQQQEELDSNVPHKPHEPLIGGKNSAVTFSQNVESIPVDPSAPLEETILDVRDQSPSSPAFATFLSASHLRLSPPSLPVASVANIGMLL